MFRGHWGQTPLFVACKEGHLECAKLLIPGSDINAQSEDGFTPLHAAALYGRLDCARLLLNAGARTGILNNIG